MGLKDDSGKGIVKSAKYDTFTGLSHNATRSYLVEVIKKVVIKLPF